MQEAVYNRQAAADYAQQWALKRNSRYLNFDKIGGDCTNFASQCIYAGSGVMNHTKTFGWYYYSAGNRSPSWTGVAYLHNFLVQNKGMGPYAAETDRTSVQIGDLVQLGKRDGWFYHSPVIVGIKGDEIYVAAHTYDAYMRPLSSYVYERVRYLHILGVRK